MYVDETGGAEETVTSEEMTVTVDGTDYTAELNADLSGDGQADTAVIDNADGTKSVYADTDGDKQADAYAEVDSSGNVVAEARFDDATGEWVAVDPSAPAGGDPGATPTGSETPSPDETSTSGGDVIIAELPDGQEVEVGPATLDTNGDSVNDTSVAEDPDGVTYYFTDADGDGEADYLVVVSPDGTTQALEHQGGGQWAPTEGGAAPGAEPPASGLAGDSSVGASGAQAVQGVAKIDALSGQWISPN